MYDKFSLRLESTQVHSLLSAFHCVFDFGISSSSETTSKRAAKL